MTAEASDLDYIEDVKDIPVQEDGQHYVILEV